MEKLTVRDITKKYIQENFKLDDYREWVKIPKFCGSIDVHEFAGLYDKVKPDVFLDFFKEKFKDADLVEIVPYYDSTEFNLYKEDDILETDDEVVLRLQAEVKSSIRVQNKEDKQRSEYERLKRIYED